MRKCGALISMALAFLAVWAPLRPPLTKGK